MREVLTKNELRLAIMTFMIRILSCIILFVLYMLTDMGIFLIPISPFLLFDIMIMIPSIIAQRIYMCNDDMVCKGDANCAKCRISYEHMVNISIILYIIVNMSIIIAICRFIKLL